MRVTRWRLSCRALLVILALVCGVAMSEDAPSASSTTAALPPPPAGDPAQWVSKLNSDDFDERNAASDNLAKMGEAARPALEKGASGSDPEIKAAAVELLGKLSQATLSMLALDRNGKPLPGMTADLTLYKDVNNGNQQPQPVTTGTDGTVQLTKSEPAVYNLYMNWKKAANVSANYVSRLKLQAGANRFIAQLTAGGTCEARALDANGKPLKDARLFLCPSVDVGEAYDDLAFSNRYGRPELTQSSDDKGIAKFENLTDGVYRAVWSQDTCETTLGPVVRITEGQLTKVPDVTLPAKVRGTMQLTLLKEDGKPLEKTHFFISHLPATDDPAVLRKALKAEYTQHMYDNGQAAPQQTDEKGKVTLENLKPGKFNLLIRTTNAENQGRIFFRGNGNDQTENMVEYSARDLEIKTGAPIELTLKPEPGGSVKGKIVNDKGEPYREAMVSLINENYLVVAGVQVFMQNYYDPAGMYTRYAQDKQDGSFEFSHLRPGKYALSVHGRSGEQAIVYGIEVADSKAADVPEIKMPTPKKAFGEIKGKVLLANAAPGANATVYLETVSNGGRSSSGINTNQKGEFNFNLSYYNMGYLPNRLKVSLNGYHPVTLDLTAPDVKADDLVINLLKRDYGKLCVKTVDEAGKPLAGVRVWPMPSNPNIYYFGRQTISRMQRTNAAGEVHFSGLADGPRKVQIDSDGYFSDPEATARINGGDEETVFKAVLHTGLKIAGHLDLPAGVAADSASIILTDRFSTSIWATVKADGSFAFSGLAPGQYTLLSEVPGCGSVSSSTQITLAKDQKGPLPVQMKVVRNGGAAVNLGAALAGRTAHLFPESFFTGDHPDDYWVHTTRSDTIDGSGRAQLVAALGTYRVVVNDQDPLTIDYTEQNQVSTMRVAGTATLQPLKSYSDVALLEAKELKVGEALASVSFTLTPQFPAGIAKDRLTQTVTFVFVGSNAIGSFYFNLQQHQQQQAPAAMVIGTPPKELAAILKGSSENLYTAKHLPAGDYKLFEIVNNQAGKPTAITPLTQFTIKDGQKLELPEVKFNFPAPTPEELDQSQPDYFGYDGTDEDKVEVFKP